MHLIFNPVWIKGGYHRLYHFFHDIKFISNKAVTSSVVHLVDVAKRFKSDSFILANEEVTHLFCRFFLVALNQNQS